MSKSIYDEALEIMIDNILPREGGKVNKAKVIKALLQAQKQEKLLDLYKQLVNENLQINLSVLEKIKEKENE